MPASANPVPAGNGIENTAEATFGKVKLIRTLMFNTAQVRANELPGSVPGGTSRTVTSGVLIDE